MKQSEVLLPELDHENDVPLPALYGPSADEGAM